MSDEAITTHPSPGAARAGVIVYGRHLCLAMQEGGTGG